MGTITLQELLRLYTLEKITDQQAIGQMLQHLVEMDALLLRLEKLEREIERLKAFVGMEPKKKKEKYDNESED